VSAHHELEVRDEGSNRLVEHRGGTRLAYVEPLGVTRNRVRRFRSQGSATLEMTSSGGTGNRSGVLFGGLRRVGHVHPPAAWLWFKVSGSNFVTTPGPTQPTLCVNCGTNLSVRELDSRKSKSYARARARDAFQCCLSKTVPRARKLISCWW
jgi:hypothetical protein